MREAGLLSETRKLLGQVERPTAPPLTAVGYRHLVQYLLGEWTEEEAYARLVRDTLRLAKRQRTWFKRERRAARRDATVGPEALRAEVLRLWEA
jgi:tRNA dimethylallyltransferase